MDVGTLAARLRALWDELGELEGERDRLWGIVAGGYNAAIAAQIFCTERELMVKYDEYRATLDEYEAAADAAGTIWHARYGTEA